MTIERETDAPTPPHCHRCRHHVGVFASFCGRQGSTRIPDVGKPPEWCPGFESVAGEDLKS